MNELPSAPYLSFEVDHQRPHCPDQLYALVAEARWTCLEVARTARELAEAIRAVIKRSR